MRRIDREYASFSALRKRLTHLNNALKGCDSHPNGMSRLTRESIEQELPFLHAELQKRREAAKVKK